MGKVKIQEHLLMKELKTVTTKAVSICKEITPEWARYMLDNHNGCNRTLYIETAKKYACSMEGGTWMASGEPIIISDEGNILNGQHRLLAICIYGKPVAMMVTEGIDQASFAVMDMHSKRSCGQVLGIMGVQNATLVASILKLVCVYNANKAMPAITNKFASNDVVILEYDKAPHVGLSATIAQPKSLPIGMTASVFGFCHYVCARIDKEDADFFYRQISEGESIVKGDPAYTVIKICRNQYLKDVNPSQKERVILFFKAWNHFRRGERVHRIRTTLGPNENFPLLK